MCRSRPLLRLLPLLAALLPAGAAAIEPGRLAGRWCLTEVVATDGSRSRPIAREWTFARGQVLRVQSEANADVRMSVGYRLEANRLIVPDLGLRLMIEGEPGARMSALGRDGELRYRFRRGRCRAADREAVRESRSDADGGRGRGAQRDDRARGLP